MFTIKNNTKNPNNQTRKLLPNAQTKTTNIKAWFRGLVRHQSRKRIGPIPQLSWPIQGPFSELTHLAGDKRYYLYNCIPLKSVVQIGFNVLPLYNAKCPSNVENKMS